MNAQPDIRDIRGPIHIPSLWPWLLLALGIAIVLVALVAATRWLVRRLRQGRIRTPAELALERLERARAVARPGHAAELAAEASDAVRVYIEAGFALRAAHRTTEEFLHDLLERGASPIAAHRPRLGEFLEACDLAKFARFDLPVEQMVAMIDAGQAFVRATAATPLTDAGALPETVTRPQEARR